MNNIADEVKFSNTHGKVLAQKLDDSLKEFFNENNFTHPQEFLIMIRGLMEFVSFALYTLSVCSKSSLEELFNKFSQDILFMAKTYEAIEWSKKNGIS